MRLQGMFPPLAARSTRTTDSRQRIGKRPGFASYREVSSANISRLVGVLIIILAICSALARLRLEQRRSCRYAKCSVEQNTWGFGQTHRFPSRAKNMK